VPGLHPAGAVRPAVAAGQLPSCPGGIRPASAVALPGCRTAAGTGKMACNRPPPVYVKRGTGGGRHQTGLTWPISTGDRHLTGAGGPSAAVCPAQRPAVADVRHLAAARGPAGAVLNDLPRG
jgi:hypothetical protein